MTKGKTALIQKGSNTNYYKPINCLRMVQTILMSQLREEIYYSVTSRELFHEEQKRCCWISRDSRVTLHRSADNPREQDQTEISSYVLDWLQKGIWYGSQTWIINGLKMYKILHEVIKIIEKTMKTRKVEQAAGGWSLAEAKVQRCSRRCSIIVTIHDCDDATTIYSENA